MKADKPVGNALLAPLFLRMTLGIYFLVAGWMKIQHLEIAVEEFQALHLFPTQLSTLLGILMPYLEMGAGVLLIIGLWTTLAGMISAVLLLCYVYALGLFPIQTYLLNKDVILFAVALSVMFSGGGAYSIDRFRTSVATKS